MSDVAALLLMLAMAPADASALIDPRDGEHYSVARHGGLDWMTQNLRWRGDPTARCYGDDDTACKTHGALYSTAAAQRACPTGWRLPTSAELRTLAERLGGASASIGTPAAAGAQLATGGAAGFSMNGRYLLSDAHEIWLIAPEPGTDPVRRVIGWHRYPVAGGHAFEPTERAAADLDRAPAALMASVRCVRPA